MSSSFTAHSKKPELFEAVLIVVALKQTLRLVFGDQPICHDLIIQRVVIPERGVPVEYQNRRGRCSAGEWFARQPRELADRLILTTRVGAEDQGPIGSKMRDGFQNK